MLDKKTVSQCISSDYCRGWNDAVDEMPHWISVKDRQPEEFEDVLVRVNIGDASWYEVAHWRAGYWSVPCITHWMPIPPYVEKEA